MVNTTNIDSNIGTRMSWEEIAKTYPDMFVALEDYQTSKKVNNHCVSLEVHVHGAP